MRHAKERRLVFFLVLIVVGYVLLSAAIALVTANDCGANVPKEWEFVPPKWECGAT